MNSESYSHLYGVRYEPRDYSSPEAGTDKVCHHCAAPGKPATGVLHSLTQVIIQACCLLMGTHQSLPRNDNNSDRNSQSCTHIRVAMFYMVKM